MKDVTYFTKAWSGDYRIVGNYHPNADVIIGNNMQPEEVKEAKKLYGKKFVYAGETATPYIFGEMEAVRRCKTKYILWYASDVKPPDGDWIPIAKKLLKQYPLVSPFWSYPFGQFVEQNIKEDCPHGFVETDFGYESHVFSDHAYLAETKTMRSIDYNLQHPIGGIYPAHGLMSFERNVGMWLAATGKKIARLKDYQYRHTLDHEK